MGTIAARDARTVVELVRDAAALHLAALCQAADLRGAEQLGAGTRAAYELVREHVPFLDEDRAWTASCARSPVPSATGRWRARSSARAWRSRHDRGATDRRGRRRALGGGGGVAGRRAGAASRSGCGSGWRCSTAARSARAEWHALASRWSFAADARYRACAELRSPAPDAAPIRLGVKDTVDVAGFPTRLGLRRYRHYAQRSAAPLRGLTE